MKSETQPAHGEPEQKPAKERYEAPKVESVELSKEAAEALT